MRLRAIDVHVRGGLFNNVKYLTGAVIGHRTLQRYYRQKLKPDRRQNSAALSRALAQYRSLGWTGTTGYELVNA